MGKTNQMGNIGKRIDIIQKKVANKVKNAKLAYCISISDTLYHHKDDTFISLFLFLRWIVYLITSFDFQECTDAPDCAQIMVPGMQRLVFTTPHLTLLLLELSACIHMPPEHTIIIN